jgi:drug/metabolite transporter (DMT)-like permease
MKNHKLYPIFLLVILAVIWGSSFILMKEGLKTFNSWQVAAYRIFIAGLVFTPFTFKYLKQIKKSDRVILLVAGLVGSGIPAFLFTYAQMTINSSTAGALNALTPIFTLLIGVLFLGIAMDKLKLLGVIIGLSGALALILLKPGGQFQSATFHGFLIILATLMYGVNVNLIKIRLSAYNSWAIASLPLIFMFIPSLMMLFFVCNDIEFDRVNSYQGWVSFVSVNILGLVGTAFSLVLFNKLIKITDAVLASSVTYLIPIVAMFWGFVSGETIGYLQLIGLGLILIGVAVIRKSNRAT